MLRKILTSPAEFWIINPNSVFLKAYAEHNRRCNFCLWNKEIIQHSPLESIWRNISTLCEKKLEGRVISKERVLNRLWASLLTSGGESKNCKHNINFFCKTPNFVEKYEVLQFLHINWSPMWFGWVFWDLHCGFSVQTDSMRNNFCGFAPYPKVLTSQPRELRWILHDDSTSVYI